ncbi:hypothetical protein RWE15_22265 [Virgibacillus halophilus]|uniref:Winged helix DNA-binding domain-containing protein n=1 Tax=Tigheibacillus halophilus TaxID=361280 RepID=A0ABU5CBY7_9BACI|nr:hypothetical protein [Virgibacillus halophilus]
MEKYFSVIIVHACLHMQHARSYTAIYHLLQGKKSIQTLQDAKLFDMESLLGVYKRLSIPDFKQELRELLYHGMIDYGVENKKIIHVTELGKKRLEESNAKSLLSRFRGMDFAGKDDIFILRLMLLIQTLTNSKKREYVFYTRC